jgi:hypothetical protein
MLILYQQAYLFGVIFYQRKITENDDALFIGMEGVECKVPAKTTTKKFLYEQVSILSTKIRLVFEFLAVSISIL